MVVMLGSHFTTAYIKPSDYVKIETFPKGIFSSSLFKRNELCFLPSHYIKTLLVPPVDLHDSINT